MIFYRLAFTIDRSNSKPMPHVVQYTTREYQSADSAITHESSDHMRLSNDGLDV